MNRYSADHDPRPERHLLIGWWRLAISVVVAVLICALAALIVNNLQLSRDLKRATDRLSQLGTSVTRGDQDATDRLEILAQEIATARENTLKSDDLNTLRTEIETSLGQTRNRVSQLESRTRSVQEVFSSASRSILFLQGSYQLLDPESDKPLRTVVNEAGTQRMFTEEIPMVDPNGNGPVYEPVFTGTGFMVSGDGLVMTNRHVALPWEHDTLASVLLGRGITPKLTRLWGYLPGIEELFELSLIKASDQADLALLRCNDITESVPALVVSEQPAIPGSEVIVMGYPTGLRALLARAGTDYRDASREDGIDSYWQLAQKLSVDRLIQPLASRGIVGQTTAAHVVYDAETTSGGSGGPVLNLAGQVVAVNTAILPDFDGSNLGVPARLVLELIQSSRDRE